MRHVTEYGENHAYVLANNKVAQDAIMKFLDGFMTEKADNKSFIFICYHVQDDVILLHFKPIEHDTDFDSALQLIVKDILSDEFRADDRNLKKALNDPHATTAKFLLDYIASEK